MPSLSTSTNGIGSLDDLLPSDEDLLYEEELLRNPYSLRMWWRYLEARKDAPAKRRYLMFERALTALPGSYKLWHAYLKERRAAVRGLAITSPAVEALNNTYERAMVSMHKMPRIWLEYLDHLLEQRLVTQTRRTFDRALSSLPITQHERVWPMYLKFVTLHGMPVDTAMRVYRRYLKLMPHHTEEYIEYLKTKGRWGEVAQQLAGLVNDDMFVSLEGKSKHQLWLELCDIITRHPNEVQGLRVDAILRSGIRRFTDEVGRLWTSLADYYIRRGLFERARDVYEEGLTTVVTVRDFSLIFDALTQFEESLLAARMEQLGDEEEEEDEDMGDGDEDGGADFLLRDNGNDLDLRLARLEHLMERRPELLSSVMLRQNPHNVHEWHKRARLFKDNPARQVLTYTEAVRTVDVDKAIGKPYTLWVAFAKVYEAGKDLANARVVFDKATQAQHKYLDDLASVWSEWAEMELRHNNFKRALDLMRTALAVPDRVPSRQEEAGLPVQRRLYRSLKLWSFYCDLEESLGTLESTRAVYDRILDLRIATPQIILNYALFLQEQQYYEDSFQVYERGVALFKYPHVKDIWTTYLTQFVQRYGGQKIERTRDLFRTALEQCPAEHSRPLFLQYASFEEAHGLARSAMEVFDRAVQTVPVQERLPIYELYLARASDFFGVGKVREVYEQGIESSPPYQLADEDCKTLVLRYAAMERQLGEIDRARAILVHGSSLADPRTDRNYWHQWNEFEVKHGNEDTFREMLRIKRSVAASFAQTQVLPTAPGAAVGGAGDKRKRGDDMEALEQQQQQAEPPARALPGFVSAGTINAGPEGKQKEEAAAPAANPEDIELEDVEEEEEGAGTAGGGEEVAIEEQKVPEAVFGGAAANVGALERFRKAKD